MEFTTAIFALGLSEQCRWEQGGSGRNGSETVSSAVARAKEIMHPSLSTSTDKGWQTLIARNLNWSEISGQSAARHWVAQGAFSCCRWHSLHAFRYSWSSRDSWKLRARRLLAGLDLLDKPGWFAVGLCWPHWLAHEWPGTLHASDTSILCVLFKWKRKCYAETFENLFGENEDARVVLFKICLLTAVSFKQLWPFRGTRARGCFFIGVCSTSRPTYRKLRPNGMTSVESPGWLTKISCSQVLIGSPSVPLFPRMPNLIAFGAAFFQEWVRNLLQWTSASHLWRTLGYKNSNAITQAKTTLKQRLHW